MNTCPYVCNNKTIHGYCMSTACINPMYNQQSITKWLEKADYVQVVRCKDCKWWTKQEASLQGRCDAYGMYPTGEWYCARGERKVS